MGGNPDFIHGTGVGVLHYLKAITSWLSLGAELAYQASPQLPGGHVAVVSAAARIAKENDYTFAATLGNGGQAHLPFIKSAPTIYQSEWKWKQISKFKSQQHP